MVLTPTRQGYMLFGTLLFASLAGQAQQRQEDYISGSISGISAEPYLFNNVTMSTAELVAANLQVSKDNELEKVVITPIKFFSLTPTLKPGQSSPTAIQNIGVALKKNVPNFKINLAQKSGISTVGLGYSFDDSSPFSNRGKKIRTALRDRFNRSPPPATPVEPSIPKVTMPVLPIRGQNETEAEFLEKLAEYQKLALQYQTEILKYEEDLATYKTVLKATADAGRNYYINLYDSLLVGSTRVTVGYNWTLFEVLGGDKVDLDLDGKIDNQFKQQGRDVSLLINHTFTQRFSLNVGGHWQYLRPSAIQYQERAKYVGASGAFAYRLFTLKNKEEYELSEDYYKSLFVPAIVIGGTVEYLRAYGNKDFAKDGVVSAVVYTPFIDFNVSTKSKFKLGIPIRRYKSLVGDSKSLAGPFVQYTLQLDKLD